MASHRQLAYGMNDEDFLYLAVAVVIAVLAFVCRKGPKDNS